MKSMGMFVMRFLAAFVTVLFLSSAAMACVNSVQSNPEFVEVCAASDSCRRVNITDLKGASDKQRSSELQDILQSFLDVRQPIAALDPVDPDKGSNPDRGSLFWSDADGEKKSTILDGATHLVGRGCVVTIPGFNRTDNKFEIKVSVAE